MNELASAVMNGRDEKVKCGLMDNEQMDMDLP